MKKGFSLLAAASVLLMSVAACQQDEKGEETGPKTLNAPSLSADMTSVEILDYSDDVCLKYSWNDVAPEGTYPTYTIQLAKSADTGFSSAVEIDCTGPQKQLSSNLLSAIASDLGADIKSGFDMIARVTVSIKGYEDALSNTISVRVGQKKYTVIKLFIAGEALESEEVQEFSGQGGTFTWTGHLLRKADFKFLCQNNGDLWPAIVRDINADEYWTAKLGYSTIDDFGFQVATSGIYTITVDAEDSYAVTLSVELVSSDDQVKVTELYMFGEATASGTSLESAAAFTAEEGVFTWEGHLDAGKGFRFLTQNTAEWPAILISEDGSSVIYATAEEQAEVYTIETPGIYKITVNAADIDDLSYTISLIEEDKVLKTIYLVGAFNWGWSLENAEQMTTEDGITYTWSGFIWGNADFKFLCQNDAWAPGYNRDANSSNYWKMVYRASGADPDVQFQVPENGNYIITINLETLAIKVRKASDSPSIYLVGAFNWGWSLENAEQMTTEDGISYTWSGFIWGNADFKFLCQNDAWAPGYNRDANSSNYWKMVYRASGADPDVQFQVPENGDYTITINIETMSIKVVKAEPVPDYPKIYPIGCINDWGWDLSKIQPMETKDGITYTIVAKVWADNNFKFLCQNDAWAPGYTRDADAEDYFTVVYNDGSLPDTQFRLDTQGLESATYKITLNVQTRKLTFEKQE